MKKYKTYLMQNKVNIQLQMKWTKFTLDTWGKISPFHQVYNRKCTILTFNNLYSALHSVATTGWSQGNSLKQAAMIPQYGFQRAEPLGGGQGVSPLKLTLF